MEIRAYNALDLAATVVIAPRSLLARGMALLDGFRQFVGEHGIAEVPELNRALSSALREMTPSHEEGAEELEQRYEVLLRNALRCSSEQWLREASIEVRRTQLTRALYLTRYVMGTVLVLLVGREAGLEQLRAYLDWSISHRPAPESQPETLREMWGEDVEWNEQDQGQDAVTALHSEGRLLKKVTACRIHHVLSPLGDQEMMQTIACYPDFANTHRTNPHFVLTRTQDLMSGGTCCDMCFHDVRKGEAVHPRSELFESL